MRCQSTSSAAGAPCQPCQRSAVSCTFSDGDATPGPAAAAVVDVAAAASSPVMPQRTMTAMRSSPPPTSPHACLVLPPDDEVVPGPNPSVASAANGAIEQWPRTTTPAEMPDIFSGLGAFTQISQSLNAMEGHYYQLSGASSDEDPWLLRHCKFDEFGFRRFFRVHIRNAGGVPTREKIPAHFIVSERGIHDVAAPEGGVGQDGLREELARLVPPNHGQRLLRL